MCKHFLKLCRIAFYEGFQNGFIAVGILNNIGDGMDAIIYKLKNAVV